MAFIWKRSKPYSRQQAIVQVLKRFASRPPVAVLIQQWTLMPYSICQRVLIKTAIEERRSKRKGLAAKGRLLHLKKIIHQLVFNQITNAEIKASSFLLG
jgi:hypothetical protein